MGKKKPVENPVLIACRIERFSGEKNDKGEYARKITSIEPAVIVAASEAQTVVRDLNAKVVNKPDSKTKRTFIVCPTTGDGNEVVEVIENADAYVLKLERDNKRKALKAIPSDVRDALGLPAPDANDDAIDAWTPNAAVASK